MNQTRHTLPHLVTAEEQEIRTPTALAFSPVAYRDIANKPFSELTVEENYGLCNWNLVQKEVHLMDSVWLGVPMDQIVDHRHHNLFCAHLYSQAVVRFVNKYAFRPGHEALPAPFIDPAQRLIANLNSPGEQVLPIQVRYYGHAPSIPEEPIVMDADFRFTSNMMVDEGRIVLSSRRTESGMSAARAAMDAIRQEVRQLRRESPSLVVTATGTPVFMSDDQHRTWDDLILPENEKNLLRQTVRSFGNIELYRKHGVPCRRTLLFHGPPGCGKSTAIKVLLAEHPESARIFLDPDDLDCPHPAERMSIILKRIDAMGDPCIVVMEDCDTILRSRQGSRRPNPLLGTMLSAMDSALTQSQVPVLFLMTTNFPGVIDDAARRKGRIDFELEFHPPGDEERIQLLKLFAGPSSTINADYSKLARQTEGLSGAEIRELVVRAKLQSLERHPNSDILELTTPDFTDSLDSVRAPRRRAIGIRKE